MARNAIGSISSDAIVSETLTNGPISEIKVTETGGSQDLLVNIPAIHGPSDAGDAETFVVVAAGTSEYFSVPNGDATQVDVKNAASSETPSYRIETMSGSYQA